MSGALQLFKALVGRPTAPVVTLDPANTGSGVTLSNGNLTATKSSGGIAWKMSRATLSVTSGKFYAETKWIEFSNSYIGVGIGDASASVENYYGLDNHGLIYVSNGSIGQVYQNGSPIATIQTTSEGDTVAIAFDCTAKLCWFKTNTGNWNNNPSANPATGAGGISFASLMTAPYFVAAGVQFAPTDQMNINFGPGFIYAAPAGFLAINGETPFVTPAAPSISALRAVTVTK